MGRREVRHLVALSSEPLTLVREHSIEQHQTFDGARHVTGRRCRLSGSPIASYKGL
jgi:hypothetical protein